MQKDVHANLTYFVARALGMEDKYAERVAWANQNVDEVIFSDAHGIQTQCKDLVQAMDTEIQMVVLVAFHFVPGNSLEHPWMVESDSGRVRLLSQMASPGDLLRLGIGLHARQDSFSHGSDYQDPLGFTGFREDLNSCGDWFSPDSVIPNIGHAELFKTPDIVSAIWTDNRNGKIVDNRKRALACAKSTYDCLSFHLRGTQGKQKGWEELEKLLIPVVMDTDYDNRKYKLAVLAGDPSFSFAEVDQRIGKELKYEFQSAAMGHLSAALESFSTLPKRCSNG